MEFVEPNLESKDLKMAAEQKLKDKFETVKVDIKHCLKFDVSKVKDFGRIVKHIDKIKELRCKYCQISYKIKEKFVTIDKVKKGMKENSRS